MEGVTVYVQRIAFPRINQLIDFTIGYELLMFMDAFSSYN